MTEPPAPAGDWHVAVRNTNDGHNVEPVRNIVGIANWPMGLPFWTRLRGGGNYRLQYPKTEAQLRRSIALCEEWIIRRKAKDAALEERRRRVFASPKDSRGG